MNGGQRWGRFSGRLPLSGGRTASVVLTASTGTNPGVNDPSQ